MRRLTSEDFLDSLEALSRESGLKVVPNLSKTPFVKDKIKILPYAFVQKHTLLPFQEEEGLLYIAVSDPYDLESVEEIKYITGTPVKPFLSTKEAILEAIERCYAQNQGETSKFFDDLKESDEPKFSIENQNEYDLLSHETDSSVIKILNMILIEALNQAASDIHFEPVEKGLLVRYRVDGVLQIRHSLTKEVQMPLATRIKVLSQLDIAEHRLPQDGRIKLRMGGREIDFRVSTIPVAFGERIVLRILDRNQVLFGLDKLGMRQEILSKIESCIRKPQGIILVTGPTGSGKSTTLYSILSEIRSSMVNIMTIEDPVEFKIEGMAQMSVNNKIHLSFATGLRHILRQDPDVIMIGEIRDRETAEIAIQASLTGHLVLSTLHTNDAASAIARLVDMGIEPYLLTSSLLSVIAQRLVRRICPECKTSYSISRQELEERGIPCSGENATFFQGSGCKACHNTGYKGRQGIYEIMPLSRKIKEQILKSADSSNLQTIALKEGMSSIREEGLKLAIEGVTSLEEVIRVSRALEEEVL